MDRTVLGSLRHFGPRQDQGLGVRDDCLGPCKLGVPDECFGPCNDAFNAAKAIGLTARLCAPESPFQGQLNSCLHCIAVKDDNSSLQSVSLTYLTPEFAEFIDYCHPTSVQRTIVYTGVNSQLSTLMLLALGGTAAPNSSTPSAITTTPNSSTPSAITTTRNSSVPPETTTTRSSSAPFEITATSNSSAPSETIVTLNGTTPSLTKSPTSHATTAPTSAAAESPPEAPPAGSSNQSIAGPVAGSIGGVFLLALVVAGAFLLHRRRSRARQAVDLYHYDKAQLHSDHLPRDAFSMHEMEAWQPPEELAAAEPVRPAELPAMEVAAHEMHNNTAPRSQLP